MSRMGRRRRIVATLSLAGALLMLAVGPGCIDVARLMATPTPGPEAGVTIIVPVTVTIAPPAIACTPQPPVCLTPSPPPPTIVVPIRPPVMSVTATPGPCEPCLRTVP